MIIIIMKHKNLIIKKYLEKSLLYIKHKFDIHLWFYSLVKNQMKHIQRMSFKNNMFRI